MCQNQLEYSCLRTDKETRLGKDYPKNNTLSSEKCLQSTNGWPRNAAAVPSTFLCYVYLLNAKCVKV